jgi:hypothetical protein
MGNKTPEHMGNKEDGVEQTCAMNEQMKLVMAYEEGDMGIREASAKGAARQPREKNQPR